MCIGAVKPHLSSVKTVAPPPPREGDNARSRKDDASESLSDSEAASQALTQSINGKGSSDGEEGDKSAGDEDSGGGEGGGGGGSGDEGGRGGGSGDEGGGGRVEEHGRKGTQQNGSPPGKARRKGDTSVQSDVDGEGEGVREHAETRGGKEGEESRKRKRQSDTEGTEARKERKEGEESRKRKRQSDTEGTRKERGSGGEDRGRGERKKKVAEVKRTGKEVAESAPPQVSTPKARGGYRQRHEKSAASKPNRYKNVERSALRMMLEAAPSVISQVRMRFQLLAFMRDGVLLNKAASARNTNIGLLLDAAQQVMEDHERYNKFFSAVCDAMDAGMGER